MEAKTLQEFNERFFKSKNGIKWFNEKGVFQLNDNTNIEIQLAGSGGDYCRYDITIINKINGKITSHTFNFNNYLKTRIDDRRDYTGGFTIIGHCGCDWYIAIPNETEVKEMANKIFEYINLWG